MDAFCKAYCNDGEMNKFNQIEKKEEIHHKILSILTSNLPYCFFFFSSSPLLCAKVLEIFTILFSFFFLLYLKYGLACNFCNKLINLKQRNKNEKQNGLVNDM